ncbi:MAG: ATP-binding cassette domain-containing protein [Chloroflexi bacterium]|nr:ATP-binding cassette domain-containing protein [Chloroflexota bacterium]
MADIDIQNLCKYYRVHQKEPGLAGSIRSFVARRYKDVKAVDDVSFTIARGEVVGFLGPNGAGKTTTLKVLSGLLFPTAGEARVLGFLPHKRGTDFLRQITLVMGQKQQLLWDLPAIETFLVNQAIYEIPATAYRQTLAELNELLDLGPLLKKQVRKLSLGERMKCELAAALLHRPRVLFLDEPTIGLDVTMQTKMRQFIAEYNRRHGATIVLTSHYMADVTALCKRVIIIDHGRLLYDGNLETLAQRLAPYKIVSIVARAPLTRDQLLRYGDVQEVDTFRAQMRVPRGHSSEVIARLLQEIAVDDVTVEEPPIEDIISEIFLAGGVSS